MLCEDDIGSDEVEDELSSLTDITTLVGHQVKAQNERWWACNSYEVNDENMKATLAIYEEEAHPAIVRAICSTNRPFFMSVFDKATNNKILEFERLMKCCSPIFFPWSRTTIIVRDRRAEILGFVKHAARETCVSWFSPSVYYEISDEKENIEFIIQGPGGCVFECKRPSIFRIMNSSLSRQVGEISHDWRGCCGGSFSVFLSPKVDNFTLRVDKNLPVKSKALLFGALMLAHFNYMEVL